MRDIPEPPQSSLARAKFGTVAVAVVATLISLFAKDNVYTLVTFAFTGLGPQLEVFYFCAFLTQKSLSGGPFWLLWPVAVLWWCGISWDTNSMSTSLFQGLCCFLPCILSLLSWSNFLRKQRPIPVLEKLWGRPLAYSKRISRRGGPLLPCERSILLLILVFLPILLHLLSGTGLPLGSGAPVPSRRPKSMRISLLNSCNIPLAFQRILSW